jgi:hypothetical protein
MKFKEWYTHNEPGLKGIIFYLIIIRLGKDASLSEIAREK